MGLMDQLGSAVAGAAGKAGGSGMNAMLLQQLIGLLSKPGALNALMGSFNSNGLGNVLQSWIGTEQNLPISADQVKKVLGQGTVSDLAQKAGVQESDAAQALTSLLPQVIDKLTPDGNVPSKLDLGGVAAGLGKLFS